MITECFIHIPGDSSGINNLFLQDSSETSDLYELLLTILKILIDEKTINFLVALPIIEMSPNSII